MARYVLVRQGGEEISVPETNLPAEAMLHDALTNHPELLPTEDFGFGRTVVIGREASLASGYADLVLIDERGQLCLVEVKKEGNPDTRQVVAQLVDYAGAIWGQSLDEFERSVLAPFAKSELGDSSVSLRGFLEERFGFEADVSDEGEGARSPNDPIDSLELGLSTTLDSGRFVLVVAAPEIPPGVRRAIDYLNAQGMRMFGVEISYFAEPAEVFVPRIVVTPPTEQRLGGARSLAEPVDREAFLTSLDPDVSVFISESLDQSAELGAEVSWRPTGPTIKVRNAARAAAVAQFEQRRAYLFLAPAGGFSDDLFERFRLRLNELGLGFETEGKGLRRIDFESINSPHQLGGLHSVILDMCESMLAETRIPAVHIEPPLQ